MVQFAESRMTLIFMFVALKGSFCQEHDKGQLGCWMFLEVRNRGGLFAGFCLFMVHNNYNHQQTSLLLSGKGLKSRCIS